MSCRAVIKVGILVNLGSGAAVLARRANKLSVVVCRGEVTRIGDSGVTSKQADLTLCAGNTAPT